MARLPTGLYGFRGAAPGGDSLAQLGDMIAAAGTIDDCRVLNGPGWAIGASPGFDAADVAEADGCVGAIAGRWQWRLENDRALARNEGDARALVRLWREVGADLPTRLGGAFAFAVIETRGGGGILAIDRMGVQSLAYAEKATPLVFATDASAAAVGPGVERHISPRAVADYLHLYRVPAPATIFTHIAKLLPGHVLDLSGPAAEQRPYWRMPYRCRADEPEEKLAAEIVEETRAAVVRALEGLDAGEIGTFLSGGLDSSTVTGLASERIPGVKSFTIGFNEAGFDESPYARIAAEHFATRHFEYFVEPRDVPAVFDRLVESYDEPYGNSSIIPTYYCARMAAGEGVRTMIAGDGGDEIFAGNERYVQMGRFDIYGRIPAVLRKALLDPFLSISALDHIPVLRRARSLKKGHYLSMPERLMGHDPIWFEDVGDIFTAGFAETLGNADDRTAILTHAFERHRSGDKVQKMMGMDLTLTLADSDLRKVGRMCHLAGVGVRYPMLDDRLVEFTAALPSALLVKGGELRYLFKRAFRSFLPGETIAKQKKGFGLPFLAWLSREREISEFMLDRLAGFRRRGILSDAFLDRLESAARTGEPASYRTYVWDVAALESWLNRQPRSPHDIARG